MCGRVRGGRRKPRQSVAWRECDKGIRRIGNRQMPSCQFESMGGFIGDWLVLGGVIGSMC